jgi:hypothetical protein
MSDENPTWWMRKRKRIWIMSFWREGLIRRQSLWLDPLRVLHEQSYNMRIGVVAESLWTAKCGIEWNPFWSFPRERPLLDKTCRKLIADDFSVELEQLQFLEYILDCIKSSSLTDRVVGRKIRVFFFPRHPSCVLVVVKRNKFRLIGCGGVSVVVWKNSNSFEWPQAIDVVTLYSRDMIRRTMWWSDGYLEDDQRLYIQWNCWLQLDFCRDCLCRPFPRSKRIDQRGKSVGKIFWWGQLMKFPPIRVWLIFEGSP